MMACCGDVPTMEALAAVMLLRDACAGPAHSRCERGGPDGACSRLPSIRTDCRTKSSTCSSRRVPTIFAFHGYPWLIHRLTYRRHNHDNLHVRGYKEEGTTTTPFDMCVLNNIDRFQLALDAITRVPRLASKVRSMREQWYSEDIQRHRLYVAENGEDLPEIQCWRWEPAVSLASFDLKKFKLRVRGSYSCRLCLFWF